MIMVQLSVENTVSDSSRTRSMRIKLINLAEARGAIQYCNSFTRLRTILEILPQMRFSTWLRVLGENWTTCDNISEHLVDLFLQLEGLIQMPGFLRGLAAMFLSKREQAKIDSLYIGLRHRDRDDIFHRWDCKYGGKIGFKGYLFKTYSDAIVAGFRPCKVCKPDRSPYQHKRRDWTVHEACASDAADHASTASRAC